MAAQCHCADTEFPDDVCQEIFIKCPVRTLLQLKFIHKGFRRIIQTPHFIERHSSLQTGNPDMVLVRDGHANLYWISLNDIIGGTAASRVDGCVNWSIEAWVNRGGLDFVNDLEFPVPTCHGLLLITYPSLKYDWKVFNPTTGTCLLVESCRKFLQGLNYKMKKFKLEALAGFGYDAAKEDYKVVRLYQIKPDTVLTLIYSLKSKRWHKIDDLPNCVLAFPLPKIGYYVGGSIYWMASDGLICLDLITEAYHRIALPPAAIINTRYHLDALPNRLVLIFRNGVKTEVWALENDTWHNLISFEDKVLSDLGTRVVSYVEEKQELVLRYVDKSELLFFNLKNKVVQKLSFEGTGISLGTCHISVALQENISMLKWLETSTSTGTKKKKKKRRVEKLDQKMDFLVCCSGQGGLIIHDS